MSGPDQSDDGKGFLARWSQRKQEAKQLEAESNPEATQEAPAVVAAAASGPEPKTEIAEKFDLSSLPKLEDVTGTTDIRAFLRQGVPEHLRNEALRKSWELDPAIRNYVNPAMEYAYDWNTPAGVPGSSELGPGIDVARLVSQIMGSGPAESPETAADPANAPASDPTQPSQHDASQQPERELPTQAVRLGKSTDPEAGDSPDASLGRIDTDKAPNSELTDDAVAPQKVVRRHGSAKPTI
jgi:Protein of unknown function (DUF3306)